MTSYEGCPRGPEQTVFTQCVVLVKGYTIVGLRKLRMLPEERVGLKTEKGLNHVLNSLPGFISSEQ